MGLSVELKTECCTTLINWILVSSVPQLSGEALGNQKPISTDVPRVQFVNKAAPRVVLFLYNLYREGRCTLWQENLVS